MIVLAYNDMFKSSLIQCEVFNTSCTSIVYLALLRFELDLTLYYKINL